VTIKNVLLMTRWGMLLLSPVGGLVFKADRWIPSKFSTKYLAVVAVEVSLSNSLEAVHGMILRARSVDLICVMTWRLILKKLFLEVKNKFQLPSLISAENARARVLHQAVAVSVAGHAKARDKL
jgi:hypothetical protein